MTKRNARNTRNNVTTSNDVANVTTIDAHDDDASRDIGTHDDDANASRANVDDVTRDVIDTTQNVVVARAHNYSYVATKCREFGINPKSMRALLRRHTTTTNHRWNEQRDDVDALIAQHVARRNARTSS